MQLDNFFNKYPRVAIAFSGGSDSAFLAYLETVGEYYDISEWGAKNGIWKGYFNYAKILHNAGRYELAEELFSCLSQYCPEDFWKNMALRELLRLF